MYKHRHQTPDSPVCLCLCTHESAGGVGSVGVVNQPGLAAPARMLVCGINNKRFLKLIIMPKMLFCDLL